MMISNKSGTIPEALRNFDQLPNTANVRQPVVQALYACSAASVWRGVKDGRIPKPRKLSPRTTCWNVGELRQALSKTGNSMLT
ncbi:MAG: AlpA family phage regulatory protein [Burkholderiales bacterium]|nr:AlpA family phage regulatory protein [Nitrosomonas sp.]MCP5274010.1 AlpA family phage regulatory protein [Burkholderiales bacterium]